MSASIDAASTPVIELRGVTKSYGELEVLKGIDLAVREHEAVALIGASGSGKSTILRCIDLLTDIDDGDIYPRRRGDHRPLGRPGRGAPQARADLPGLQPVPAPDRDQERRPRHPQGPRRAARRRRTAKARELLEHFGLGGRENDAPDRLSGGQQQRVAIARAFATRPRAMLLDEVTSALDPELVGDVLRAVRELKDEGVTMILATHEMEFAREVADRVGFLHEGRLLELGPPEQVLKDPQQPETRKFLKRLLEAGLA